MTNPDQTSKANSTSSNTGKSFTVGTLTSAVSSGVLGSAYLAGLSEAFTAPADGTLALATVCIGAATAVGLATSTVAEDLVGFKKEDSYNKKAVCAGVLTGLLAAAALTFNVASGSGDQQSTAPAQQTPTPVISEMMPHMKPVIYKTPTWPVYMDARPNN